MSLPEKTVMGRRVSMKSGKKRYWTEESTVRKASSLGEGEEGKSRGGNWELKWGRGVGCWTYKKLEGGREELSRGWLASVPSRNTMKRKLSAGAAVNRTWGW
jgi:hypothetical protein